MKLHNHTFILSCGPLNLEINKEITSNLYTSQVTVWHIDDPHPLWLINVH
jgi:hypothetical protein